MNNASSPFHVVGKGVPRVDSIEKVTGQASYLEDLLRPRLLHGAILRSRIPHGRILNIDTSRATRVPGVRSILTAKDFPKTFVGFQMSQANKPPLAGSKVRYIGDEIAAVAAESGEAAREACTLIDVDFDPLPAFFSVDDALAEGAVLIHEDKPDNLSGVVHKDFGNVEDGFDASHLVVENTFQTTSVVHCCMETRGALAEFDSRGRLILWSTTQFPHVLQEIMSRVLMMPLGMIRIIKATIGGGFGSRQSMDSVDTVSVYLAKSTGRPVRLVKSRTEEFISDRTRYPMSITLKTGISREGKLIARYVNILTDNGAYNDQGLAVTTSAGSKLTGLYKVPNVRIDAKVVFTNKVWGGAFRGYGNPQITFAVESQMDDIADRLGMDRLELRLLNVNRVGDITVAGSKFHTCGFVDCLEQSASKAGWHKKIKKQGRPQGTKRYGIGMASVFHTGGGGISPHGGNFSSAFIKVQGDGTVDLLTGVPDVGQGSDTVLAQIAAEELGVRIEDMRVHAGDTGITPATLGVRGSRETFVAGNAVKLAARSARKKLLERAVTMLKTDVDALDCGDGFICVKMSPKYRISIAEVAGKPQFDGIASAFPMGVPIVGSACYTDPVSGFSDSATGYGNICPAWTYGAQVVEVEVDMETGRVKVLRVVAAHDVGKAINPKSVEGQIEGSVMQGIGMALTERLVWDDNGRVMNDQFAEYKLPLMPDTPEIISIIVEPGDPHGPFGAKGIGEAAIVPTAAAVANAIHDATGIRFSELPMTPEKVLREINLNGGNT